MQFVLPVALGILFIHYSQISVFKEREISLLESDLTQLEGSEGNTFGSYYDSQRFYSTENGIYGMDANDPPYVSPVQTLTVIPTTVTNVINSPKPNDTVVVTSTSKPTNTTSPTKTAVPTRTTAPTSTVAPTNTAVPTNTPTVVPTTDYSKPWTVAPGCPASTQRCVPCLAGTTYCRLENGQSHGFLGWSCQNNNPGNIRPSASRDNIIANNGGQRSCGKRVGTGGEYMVFATYDIGRNSLKAYIKGIALGQHSSYLNGVYNGVPQNCGQCNLKFFSSKYSGTTDQEPYNSYANKIARAIGVDANTTMLSDIVATKLDAMVSAIQVNEGWFVQ